MVTLPRWYLGAPVRVCRALGRPTYERRAVLTMGLHARPRPVPARDYVLTSAFGRGEGGVKLWNHSPKDRRAPVCTAPKLKRPT
jgi:hypothetical protein